MFKIIAKILLVLLVLGGLSGLALYVSKQPVTDKGATVKRYVGKPRLIVVLLDDTGSYPYFAKSVSKILTITKGLGPYDMLYVILITGLANETSDMVVSPDPELLQSIENTDPGQLYNPNLTAYRDNLVGQVEKIRFDGRKYTDIYGALYHASIAFQGETERDKWLLICSDLGDTASRKEFKSKTDFRGVKIQTIYFPTELIEAENRQYRPDSNQWTAELQSFSPDSVVFYNHVESDKAKLCQ